MKLKIRPAKKTRRDKRIAKKCRERGIEPGEWVRLPKPKERFHGLSRTTLLQLCQRGHVRSAYVKPFSYSKRGIRLIHLPSLLGYFHRLALKEVPVTPTKGA